MWAKQPAPRLMPFDNGNIELPLRVGSRVVSGYVVLD